MKKEHTYKPLLFTTTLRNPERLKSFLGILKDFNGQILTDELAQKISGEIIRNSLYKPKNISQTVEQKIEQHNLLSDREVLDVLKNNPQNHKEAGFNKGWSSRFDTWFKFAKEMGFVFYNPGKQIQFSKIGLNLVEEENGEFEQQAFLNAFTKYQSNNPFRRVKNENAPFILLLQIISKLNADSNFQDTGISKLEIPLVIYWQNSDAEKLYHRIKKLRQEFGYSPSWEVVIDICQNEIMQGQDIKRNEKSIIGDYPDEFIRKMRLTGLITLRGGGRFVDVNKNEQDKIGYILKNYSQYKKYDTEEQYFQYISSIDDNLFSLRPKSLSIEDREHFLTNWVRFYDWKTIKKEMLNVLHKKMSQDEILKYLSYPVRLEFLIAIAIKARLPHIKVIPNYPVDDEGIPTSTAGGNRGDIECYEYDKGVLVEVTMLEGAIQSRMETWAIVRHLEEFSKHTADSACYFVAPSIFIDSERQIDYVRREEDFVIYPKTIEQFLKYLEENKVLYKKEN